MKYLSGPLLALILTLNLYPSRITAQPGGASTQAIDPAVDIFRDVSPASFSPAVYDLDSSASAIYLFDHGVVNFQIGGAQRYSTIFERHVRLRILNTNGLSLATFGISMTHR